MCVNSNDREIVNLKNEFQEREIMARKKTEFQEREIMHPKKKNLSIFFPS
jgi:hypothetical protein